MADRVRRYLVSRKNLAGMVGALVGVSLAVADIPYWPLVAVGLYGVGALIGPSDRPAKDDQLTDALRADAADLLARLQSRSGELPGGSVPAIARILDVLRRVLDRLDQVTGQPADRLAVAAEIIRVDLPVCLDTYLGRAPSSPASRAAAELVVRLSAIAGAADGLARSVSGVRARPAAELTRELLRRHGDPPVPS